MTKTTHLPSRAVLEVSGEDRVGFLQGLVSNDVAGAKPGRAVWAALLTPQGKWLTDFLILAHGDTLLLDCERAQVASLPQRLARYRLRAKIDLIDRSDTLHVYAAWGGEPDVPADAVIAPDPRLQAAGWRILSTTELPTNATEADWDRHRIALGLPDGSRDMEAEKSVLLEAGFDELNGVSWTKGCYMGQELTARTKHRGLVKRRLVPVAIEGDAPAPGTPVLRDGADVGVMRSACGDRGLAQVRLEALGDTLACGAATLRPEIPAWMKLPDSAAPAR